MNDRALSARAPSSLTQSNRVPSRYDSACVALAKAIRVVGRVVQMAGDDASVRRFVKSASEWCRSVAGELAGIDPAGAQVEIDITRAGQRCARRYPRGVGEALCAILLAPGASTEMVAWRAVDRARESLVRVLDVLLRDARGP